MATNYVGRLIHETRIRRSMTLGDLARACGATTARATSRIAQRLVGFERDRIGDMALLRQVTSVLELDPAAVTALLERQRGEEVEEWNRWADRPVPIELHVRPFAGLWFRVSLPTGVADEDSAIEYARKLTAGGDDVRTVLMLSGRKSMTFARGEKLQTIEAKPNQNLEPYVLVGTHPVVFVAESE